MAERKGFEPSIRLLAYTLSKRAPSTARPPLLFFIMILCIQNKKMVVKKNILFSLFLLSNLQLILSLLFKRATLGQVWYFINSNSLVGVQKLIETNAKFFYDFFFIFLNSNIFFISSIISFVIIIFITDLLTQHLTFVPHFL